MQNELFIAEWCRFLWSLIILWTMLAESVGKLGHRWRYTLCSYSCSLVLKNWTSYQVLGILLHTNTMAKFYDDRFSPWYCTRRIWQLPETTGLQFLQI